MRYKRVDYTKYIGCHHDENDELTGGIPIEMVAMYDSENITDEEVQRCIQTDEETPYLMLIRKVHYDNVLKPAVEAAKQAAREE